MRKRLLWGCAAVLLALLAVGCRKQTSAADSGSRIHGTISEQYNGKRIFLVPLYGPKTAEYVDSVEVKDGRFEFTPDTLMMAKILVDYHYRMGIQPLLVVTEPGDVQVVIGAESSATGTPQNDSLEHWKQITEERQALMSQLRSEGRKAAADSIFLDYKLLTRRMASDLEGTVLGDFLAQMYPKTYVRQYPDGHEVTFDADTNEPIE